MHPTTSPSQSNHKSMTQSGLTRYVSAPGSLLNSAVDSVIGAEREFSALRSPSSFLSSHYFSGDSSSITSESTCKVNSSTSAALPEQQPKALERSYGLNEIGSRIGSDSLCSSSSPSSLIRQRSSPADFLGHFVGADNNGGFTVTRGMGSYSTQDGTINGPGVSRLKPQLSFTSHDSLSQISEASEVDHHVVKSNNSQQNTMHSYNPPTSFGMDSWNNTNSISFSSQPRKQAKNMDGDLYNCLNLLESQYSLPQTSLEMVTMERLLQEVPEDSIPCKIRAKRGCATHPRSIAERERRTRISGKLKKLQDLVPNMDKQTSYSDMLDLAVQHIKGLQNHVHVEYGSAVVQPSIAGVTNAPTTFKIQKELESCTCGCNKPTT